MKVLMVLGALSFLAPATVQAAPVKVGPDIVVLGPKQVEPGDLVVLDASDSSNIGALTWAVHPLSAVGKMLAVEAGKKVVFATSKPGSYVFYVAASSPDGKGVKIVPVEVVVGQPSPVPPTPVPPGPNPPGPTPPGPTPPGPVPPGPVPPAPDFEPWQEKLKSWTVERVMQLSDSSLKANAGLFANACDTVVSRIGSGTLPDPSDPTPAVEQISNAFRENLKGVGILTQLKWRSLLPALADKFDELKLEKPSDWGKAFEAISAGLRKVQNG